MTSLSSWLWTGLCEYTLLLHKFFQHMKINIELVVILWYDVKYVCVIYFPLHFLCITAFSDRTCTIINVEGDAFGAGILQHFTDRVNKKNEVELAEVHSEEVNRPVKPEHTHLLEKHSELEIAGFHTSEKESVM